MLGHKTNIPDDMLQRMRVQGRISGSSHINPQAENGGFFQTMVTVPASDEYSHPTTYGVNNASPLGPDGQDVDVVCDVRPYNRRGKEGGMFCNNSLWLAPVDHGGQGTSS
jgi:hypothetical protein